jgi:hypothetical protein
MNTATYRKHGMLSIKENLYNRTGMKDAKLVHAHIAPMMKIVAIRRDALLFRLVQSDNYPITEMLDILTTQAMCRRTKAQVDPD